MRETDVIGEYLWDGPWWDRSQRSEVQGAVKRAAKGEFVRFETTHPTAGGQVRNIDFSLSPVRNDNGDVIFVVPEGRDITEIRQSEEERAKLQRQLNRAQKMEAIGTLAGGIAHDFNNILSAIIGYAELSKMSLDKKGKMERYLGEIDKAGNRAKGLVQQILTFSRQTKQEQRPVSLKLIAEESLKLLRASLPVTIDIRPNLMSDSLVMGDPTQIHQIFMNLCTNAGHAMRETGGILEVVLTDVELDQAFTDRYHDLKSGPYLKLVVIDTGCGMSQDVLDRIFDPFFTTKEQGEGTGMGLAVVHGIVESCGGEIYAHSEPGEGTSFKVFLPISAGAPEQEEKTETVLSKGTERILFVDDEPALIDIGQQILERLGYKVTTALNPHAALDLFKSQPGGFDLVITDMTMPKITGDRLTAELVAVRSDIPVILCTGFSSELTDDKLKTLGIKGFLMKPIIPSEIATLIRQVLDGANHTS